MHHFLINTNSYWFTRFFPEAKTAGGRTMPNNRGLFLGLRFLCMHKILVHAQHSCACTTLLCMHWRGQGPGLGPKKAAGPVPGPGPLPFYKNLVHAQYTLLFLHNNKYSSEQFPYQRSDFLVHLHLHSRLRRIQWRIVKFCRTNT